MNNEEMSDIFEKLNGVIDKDKISPDMVNNLLSMLGNNSNNTSSSDSSSQLNSSNTSDASSPSSIDAETLLKMKSMIEAMNTKKDDPRSNLLLSLKPYLREGRKDKVEQYIQFMNMSKYIKFLPFMGGDKKKDG